MIVVVGAGASGLLASILLAKKGYKVVVLEKDKKLAKKLRATGNGKCNITNKNINLAHFHSNTPQYIKDFILSYEEIEKVFLEIGIPFVSLEDNRVFPFNKEANSVADILIYEAKRLGVNIINECEVLDIKKGFVVDTTKGIFRAKILILATGHKASKGSDSGVEFARNLGHTVYEPYPSLVQLISSEDFAKCSGVKIKAKLSLYSNKELIKQTKGDLLFTNYGISGLSVLDISVGIAKRLDEYEYVEIIADFFDDCSKERLKKLINSLKSSRHIEIALRGILPSKLVPLVLQKANIDKKYMDKLTNKDINKLIYVLKNFSIEIVGTKDFENAEVVSGGVALDEIGSNMQSKFVKGLYFLGEMIDIDGDRGGYNLHFAWSSAIKISSLQLK